MDARTAEALEASIRHWQENVNAQRAPEASTSPEDCALCRMFFRNGMRDACRGCPVFKKTGKSHCDDTPYDLALPAHENWEHGYGGIAMRDAFRIAAKAELDFLISLREPVETTPAKADAS